MVSFATFLQHRYSFEPTQLTTHWRYGHSLEETPRRGGRQQPHQTWSFIRVFGKVRKTQHQNPEFDPKPSEIQKKKSLQTSTLAFNTGGETQKCTTFLLCQTEFSSFFDTLFPFAWAPASTAAATYIFTAPTCTTIIITSHLVAWNAESFSISYPELL